MTVAQEKTLTYSGAALYLRGYRGKVHRASLNQSLAAGLILLSNWDMRSPFYDPMCGSGTFPIEATLIGKNIPPGYYRKNFAFQKWHYFDNRLWNDIVKDTRKNISHERLSIYGYDNIAANINLSKQTKNHLS